MLDNKYLKYFEKKIIEENKGAMNIDFLKTHYRTILQMANPIIEENKFILNDQQYRLIMHLFNLCYHIEYIPSL
jgi:hypothetical protein